MSLSSASQSRETTDTFPSASWETMEAFSTSQIAPYDSDREESLPTTVPALLLALPALESRTQTVRASASMVYDTRVEGVARKPPIEAARDGSRTGMEATLTFTSGFVS